MKKTKMINHEVKELERELFKGDKTETFCKTTLTLSGIVITILILAVLNVMINESITFEAIKIYLVLILCNLGVVTYCNILLEKNRYKLFKEYTENNSNQENK